MNKTLNILDVGSDKSILQKLLKISKKFKIKYIVVDPNFDFLNKIKNLFKNKKNVQVITHKTFLSNENKKIKFYKNLDPTTSSIFRSNLKVIKIFRDDNLFDHLETTEEETKNLDTFLNQNNFNQIDLLSLFTQGSELNILQGNLKKIKDVSIIRCHGDWVSRYENQPLIGDLIAYLNNAGFQLLDISHCSNYLEKKITSEIYFLNNEKISSGDELKRKEKIIEISWLLAGLGKYTDAMFLLKINKIDIKIYEEILKHVNLYYRFLFTFYPFSKILMYFFSILSRAFNILNLKIKIFEETKSFFLNLHNFKKKI